MLEVAQFVGSAEVSKTLEPPERKLIDFTPIIKDKKPDVEKLTAEVSQKALEALSIDIEEILPTGIEVVHQEFSADAPEIKVIKLPWKESNEVYKYAYAKHAGESVKSTVPAVIFPETMTIPGLEDVKFSEALAAQKVIKSYLKKESERLEGYLKSEEFQLVQNLFVLRKLVNEMHWINPLRLKYKYVIGKIEKRLLALHPECSTVGEILTIYNPKAFAKAFDYIKSHVGDAVNENLNRATL